MAVHLTDSQIDEYCTLHLPYIRGVMLGHYVLAKRGPYEDDPRILNAAFIGSLIAGRMILESLGIGLLQDKMIVRRANKKEDDTVQIDDLGGNSSISTGYKANQINTRRFASTSRWPTKQAAILRLRKNVPGKMFIQC